MADAPDSFLDDLLHPLRNHRRHAILAEPMTEEWRGFLVENVAQYACLTDEEKRRLEEDARVFAAEKQWEAGGGEPPESVTDEMRVTIAAQACLLLLGWDDARRAKLFPNVRAIIVYPMGYHAADRGRNGFVETSSDSARLGEAWSSDLPVVLSWRSALWGASNDRDGRNVVLHEFAHKLDMLGDGRADGVPRLADDAAYDDWAAALSAEYAALREDAETGHKSFLDHYGATNEAEFFAVATEAFFEKSIQMRDEHARLYDAFCDYYGQDPAERIERCA